MLRSAAFVSALLAVCLANQAAVAGKRVALVIGNSSYQNVAALTNPVNDAAAVTEMFKNASFDVVESRRDLKSQEMRRALRDFGDKARGADIAVVYFAGHGLEVDGTNYVVPVDAVLERDADVDDEAVSLNRILVAAEPATKLRLIILDACRDNPFAKKMKRTIAARSLGRGLVGVEANRPNTFIAFAAKEGSTAADGDGQNSPFSTALLKHLTTPGLDIRKAFGYVRDDVMNATGNQQEPYTTNSLGGNDVALVPAPAAAPAANDNANAEIRRDYELAERVGAKEAWDSFVAAHPSGFYADLAKAQRNKLAAETARIEATEKARLAAEEQARLAAEGARASEQAKAMAQSKAAEEAKLAAEKKTQVEDAKLAAAEQAKAAEDARLAGEKARLEAEKAAASKAASVIAPAAMAAPTADKRETDKSTGPAVALLTPGQANSDAARSNQPAPPDLPRLLQAELRRGRLQDRRDRQRMECVEPPGAFVVQRPCRDQVRCQTRQYRCARCGQGQDRTGLPARLRARFPRRGRSLRQDDLRRRLCAGIQWQLPEASAAGYATRAARAGFAEAQMFRLQRRISLRIETEHRARRDRLVAAAAQ
jgi:uncharacterized caspase-like protein